MVLFYWPAVERVVFFGKADFSGKRIGNLTSRIGNLTSQGESFGPNARAGSPDLPLVKKAEPALW